jgi:hypothetical protein
LGFICWIYKKKLATFPFLICWEKKEVVQEKTMKG